MAMLFMWMEAWIHRAKYLGFEWYNRLKWLVVQVLSIVALLIVLVWLAVFMYGSFYYTYMPSVTHTRDVHLQFRTDCEDSHRLCSFPSANLSLSKDRQNELLMRGQAYVIVVDLEVPESTANQNLGMFMVKLQLYTRHGESVATSRRSALLHYKSSLYRVIETFCYVPFYLAGARTQKQQLSITLFDNFEEDPYKPALGAFVEVQSKYVEVYSSTMRIHAKFAGLRYLLYHWPIVSALCGIGTNLFFLVVVTLLSWYRFGEVPNEPSVHSLGGTARLSLEERRNRIRAILDRERRGLSRSGSSSSFSGVPSSGIVHAYSQPNLSTHRRSASATFTPRPSPENLSHSVSTSNLEHMSSQSQDMSRGQFRISQDSIATTDYDEEDIQDLDSDKDYSTPSSGSGSRKSVSADSEDTVRHRNPVFN